MSPPLNQEELLRLSALFGFEDHDPVVAEEHADRALLIVHVAEDPRAGRAYLHAGWIQALGDAVVAPRAFFRDTVLFIEEAGAIRAGLDTILAADAVFVVDQYRAVLGLVGSAGRADLNAGRSAAMVAHLRHEDGSWMSQTTNWKSFRSGSGKVSTEILHSEKLHTPSSHSALSR